MRRGRGIVHRTLVQRAGPIALMAVLAGGPGQRIPTRDGVPAWRLAAAPSLTIGVVEGDPHYELAGAASAVRLSDGRIAVANTGSDQIYLYDARGTFLRTVGHRGGGPGEFKMLGRIYRLAGDSLAGYDGGADRLNLYTPQGEFVRTVPFAAVTGDSVFPLDVWLYRRFWVTGALSPAARAATKATLGRLPFPTTAPTYRYVRPADDGTLWIREPLAGAVSYSWTIVSASGQVRGVVRIPTNFDVYEIMPGSRAVLGRWRDENDVNFIRIYALERTEASGTVPTWLTKRAGSGLPAPLAPADRAEHLRALKTALRNLVSSEERHYADALTYTADVRQLKWEAPNHIALDIITASNRGWVGVATDPALDVICGMMVNSPMTPGWPEGMPRCG